jgi:predicted DNA-binding ribbon-helix-helix protein
MRYSKATRKHTVRINGYYTSVSPEDDFWDALTQVCRELNTTRQDFISQLALEFHGINLSSAVFSLNPRRPKILSQGPS